MSEDFHCQASKRSERRPVGSKLKELQDRLVELGGRLMRETDADATRLVSSALDAVQNQRLSVSIIGQVNAGKTTLVNALARHPGLLPASQAPWTAVITRLHFGLHGFPEQSAHFRFFDADEWQRLSEQGGKLRELAERFLPGFNSEQLHQQVQAMRHRAEARLGPAFTELLGSTHSFATLQPDVVARYVSAGPSGDEHSQTQNFADITRTADLFFTLQPFAYPLTLIDTPGTNDPFLVREEMTLKSLDGSDACIVLIDATKGVTDSDLGLFRILRGVNTQRLILFINKVDLLPDAAEQRRSMTDHITSIVRQELGNSTIPTIIGNALGGAGTGNTTGSPIAEAWLDELEDAISALIHHGHSAHYVHQAAATLMTLADGVRTQAAAQLARLQSERAISRALFDDEVERARAVAFSEDLAQQINRTTDSAISSLQRITSAYEQQALTNLQNMVETFAATKKQEFLDQYPNDLPATTINFDISELRQRILATHTHGYRRVRREVTNALRVTTAQLAFLMNKVQSDVQINLDFNAVSEDFVFPSQAPLGQTLAIDLEEPFWRRWWRRRVTPEEAADALEALILQEFLPIVSELVVINKGELASEIEYASLQLSINGTNLAQSLKSRQLSFAGPRQDLPEIPDLELVQEVDTAKPASVPARRPAAPMSWQNRFDAAQSQHHRSDLLVRDLAELTAQCQELLA